MKRLICAGGLAALALFPAGALASATRAKVLSVNRHQHTIELVDAAHVVRAYHYRGTLPRVGLADVVAYRRAGAAIMHVTRRRPSDAIAFDARVVRSGARGLRLRLGDGTAYQVPSTRVRTASVAHAVVTPAAPVTIQLLGLAPGQTVLISETLDPTGHWTLTITLPPAAATSAPGDSTGDDQVAEGAITELSDGQVAISTDAGPLRFAVDPTAGLTDGLRVGDLVDVAYHQNPDQTPTADDIQYVEQDTTGVVTAATGDSLTLTDDATGQPITVEADPALGLFAGVAVGDQVDITYHQSATGAVVDAVDDQAWDS